MRTRKLQPLWEWRFEVPFGDAATVKLLSGTAEKDGTELAANHAYRLTGTKGKLLTWHGCELEVEGDCDEYVAETAPPAPGAEASSPMVSYLNLHLLLQQQRGAAAAAGRLGPRVLIAGPGNSGKTSLARTLVALATRAGAQPLAINADVREGMLSVPGTLSAAAFGTVMDVESDGGGWGGAPSSGPAAVPVKLPLAYYYGRERAEEDMQLYRALVSRLAGSVTARIAEDAAVKAAGCVIDSPAVNFAKGGLEVLVHIAEEFSGTLALPCQPIHNRANIPQEFVPWQCLERADMSYGRAQ